MNITVIGIGYVGAVTSACLAKSGHNVIAVDISPSKVDCINKGQSPIIEHGLEDLIQEAIGNGQLRATADIGEAIKNSEISLICVGTPSREDGSLDLSHIESACEDIGTTLSDHDKYHTIVIRSTVLPGTLRDVILPILESTSGKKAGVDFAIGNNPEFLREGVAVKDYFEPTEIVVGAYDDETGQKIMALYDGIPAPRAICAPEVAEGVKYVSNAWRATKISFANEIGNILKEHDVDSHKVMDIFFLDNKINLSKSFLMPGFAFGGSCLPKDVRALRASAQAKDVQTPFLDSLLHANQEQVDRGFRMIKDLGHRNIGLLGLSFKPGTDDLRESPLVDLANRLLEDGFQLKIYDPYVFQASQYETPTRQYINDRIPHISDYLVEHHDDLTRESDVFVIGNGTREFRDVLNTVEDDRHIIDFVRLCNTLEERTNYAGICW